MQFASGNKCRCWTTFHLSKLLIAVLFSVVLTTLCFAAPSDLAATFRNSERMNNPPISSVLDQDGSIKRGIAGNFDPKGFRMVTGAGGAPRFVADHDTRNSTSLIANCGDGWDDRFGTNGPDGDVLAIAVDAAGNVYIGGYFSFVGNQPASRIAKWNGSSWSALGSGVLQSDGYDPGVWAIAVSGTDVYVGGQFTSAGGTPASNIAKWNGSSWSALGSGVYGGPVYAIAISGTDVYVGGYFLTAGGSPALHIAKWDGSNWSALGSGGYVGPVYAIATSGTDVYVGGGGIAKWNGSSWSALGSGITPGSDCYYNDYGIYTCDYGYVSAVAVSGSDVYVGGWITAAGGTPVNGIAKWNDSTSTWSALGSGVGIDPESGNAIAVSGSDVYAGGVPLPGGIAKWNGSSWSELGLGTDAYVDALAISGSDLYVGGRFSTAGCHRASNFSRYTLGTPTQTPTPVAMDFDGDSRADLSVFRPSDSVWYLNRSTDGFAAAQFGLSTDKIVPADFNGDGKSDIAVWRPENGTWYILRSEDSTFYGYPFGAPGDIPAPADFDGDGQADAAVYRPAEGVWYILRSLRGFSETRFGTAEDRPVPGDYDGDGKADIAIFRPSEGAWYILGSRAGLSGVQFGLGTDLAVPADYDGDRKTDVAVFRPSNATWYILGSSRGFYGYPFGLETDLPVPGDYDGDGKTDAAVFRPSTGAWYILGSTSGFSGTTFGLGTDQPVENAFVR